MTISRASRVTYSFTVCSHNDDADAAGRRKPRDLTKYVRSWSVSKSMYGDSVGTWSVRMKVPETSPDAVFLRAMVRDDDEVNLTWMDATRAKYMVGVVDSVARGETYGAGTGNVSRDYVLSGREWSKFLVDGQIKMTALLGFDTYRGTGDPQNAEQFIKGIFGQGDQSTWSASDGNEYGFSQLTSYDKIPRLPGIVNVPDWEALLTNAIKGTVRPADVSLSIVMKLILAGLYKSPVDGSPLLKRIVWSRFPDHGSIEGVPIRLPQIAMAGNVMTPNAIMQNFGCMAYNECFYDYDSTGNPAIVYRQKPFNPSLGYSRLKASAYPLSRESITGYNLSRSGAERYTWWRPQTLITALNGYAVMLKATNPKNPNDTLTLPFIDKSDLDEHGLRPAEPPDNFYPSFNAPDADMIWFHADRMRRYRAWMKLAPEMLSGQIQIAPAFPSIWLGEMVKLPIEHEFVFKAKGDKAKKVHKADSLLAYVVGWTDNYQVGESDGSVTSNGTISVIRGEPADGSMVPPALEQYWVHKTLTPGGA